MDLKTTPRMPKMVDELTKGSLFSSVTATALVLLVLTKETSINMNI